MSFKLEEIQDSLDSTQSWELLKKTAQRAEIARERHDFFAAIQLFSECLESKPAATTEEQNNDFVNWCRSHRGASYTRIGKYEDALKDLELASEYLRQAYGATNHAEPKREDYKRRYCWTLSQLGELHRVRAAYEKTPSRGYSAYAGELTKSIEKFKHALTILPDNRWTKVHLAAAATLAYWNGFTSAQWSGVIKTIDMSPEYVHSLYNSSIASQPNDWWGRVYQVIFYIVQHPVDFCARFDASNSDQQPQLTKWFSDMQLWWANYELAMDCSVDLEAYGMRTYSALAGRAMATAYGLTWHQMMEVNRDACRNLPNLQDQFDRLWTKVSSNRSKYLEEALENARKLLEYSPDDLFANFVMGAVLRYSYDSTGDSENRAFAPSAYLSSLRILSMTQTVITHVLMKSTSTDYLIYEGLSQTEKSEYLEFSALNNTIWRLMNAAGKLHSNSEMNIEDLCNDINNLIDEKVGDSDKHPSAPNFSPFTHSGEQVVLDQLLFPPNKKSTQ